MPSGLRVIDVADPQNPQEVGCHSTPGLANDAAVAGDHVYVADLGGGLRVIDVSDPQSPKEAGFLNTPNAGSGVTVAGTYAYVAAMWSGPRVIDVSAPWSPQEVGFYHTPGWARAVAVAGTRIYVAAYGAGLQIVEFYGGGVTETPNGEVRTTSLLPTVVRGVLMMVDRGQRTEDRAQLLDISGRKVMELQARVNDVRALAPGVYFITGPKTEDGGPRTTVRKVVVTR